MLQLLLDEQHLPSVRVQSVPQTWVARYVIVVLESLFRLNVTRLHDAKDKHCCCSSRHSSNTQLHIKPLIVVFTYVGRPDKIVVM